MPDEDRKNQFPPTYPEKLPTSEKIVVENSVQNPETSAAIVSYSHRMSYVR